MATIRILGFAQRLDDDGKPHDWVTYAPAHAVQSTQTEERVDRLMPPKKAFKNDDQGLRGAFLAARWAEIEPAYKAWKEGAEIPETGTPLSVWPGVTPDQVQVLRMAAIRTVEDIAEMPDGALGRVQLPNMRELREQAKRFLASRDTHAAAKRAADQDAEIQALKEQNEEMLRMIGELTAPKATGDSDGGKAGGKPAKNAA
jgi:hypothetical protein